MAEPISTNTTDTHSSLHSTDIYKGLLWVEPSGGSSLSEKVRVGLAPLRKINPTSCSGVVSMDNLSLSIADNTAYRCTREAMRRP